MEDKIENFKNGEHKLIWQKIDALEKHVIKINGRQWKLIFFLLTALCGFCGALILALLKILS